MATIEIDKREFEELLGRSISDEEIDENASLLGAHWNHLEGLKWEVEVYPNRPDLLSVEGLARAYRGFLDVYTGREEYESTEGETKVFVDDSVEDVRPYIGGAVVRGLELTEKKINGLIQLQEKLHQTVGRRRDKIAIGLHDLSSVEPPFEYMAVDPQSVSFTPLEHNESLHLEDILEKHDKGKTYSWILEDEDNYPVIVDDNDEVLSFPPIINNQLTEVTDDTTDIFIDVTGKDENTVSWVLNILTTALAERGGEIESVKVGDEEMPHLEPEQTVLDPEYFREISGIDLIGMRIAEKLEMMKFGAEVNEESNQIEVEVPCYRTDIMHDYDLIEDAVIAHRYNEIEPELPNVDQIGNQKDLNRFVDELRDSMIGTGAMEAHTYVLSSKERLFNKMGVKEEDIPEMDNALTEDYSVVRNWLLPSLIQVLKNNRQHSYPQKLFEVADTSILKDETAENRRKLAFAHADSEASYTDAREVLQVLERMLGVEIEVVSKQKGCFASNRSGQIVLENKTIGIIGEIDPEVLDNWGLETEVSAFELDVEKLRELI